MDHDAESADLAQATYNQGLEKAMAVFFSTGGCYFIMDEENERVYLIDEKHVKPPLSHHSVLEIVTCEKLEDCRQPPGSP